MKSRGKRKITMSMITMRQHREEETKDKDDK